MRQETSYVIIGMVGIKKVLFSRVGSPSVAQEKIATARRSIPNITFTVFHRIITTENVTSRFIKLSKVVRRGETSCQAGRVSANLAISDDQTIQA